MAEIKKLIAIRQAHPALLSRGEIEFVYVEKDAYPFAYIRSTDEERILVVINPANRETSFETDIKVQETLYSFGGEARLVEGRMVVPGGSAGFYRI